MARESSRSQRRARGVSLPPPRRLLSLLAILLAVVACSPGAGGGTGGSTQTITVAAVSNPQMEDLQKLVSGLSQSHHDP